MKEFKIDWLILCMIASVVVLISSGVMISNTTKKLTDLLHRQNLQYKTIIVDAARLGCPMLIKIATDQSIPINDLKILLKEAQQNDNRQAKTNC